MQIRFWQIAGTIAICGLGIIFFSDRDIARPPGVLAPDAPSQGEIQTETRKVGDYDLTFRASFDIRARVLSHKDYKSKPEGDLVPMDLALGWGPMSDSANLDHITIRQGTRTYGWYFDDARDLPSANIGTIPLNSANMHIIPANVIVRRALNDVRTGDIVRIHGYLTDFSGQGVTRNTSVTRSDQGPGACEIIYAQSLIIEPRPQ